MVVGLGPAGILIGEDIALEVTDGFTTRPASEEAEADTGDVCGSLSPLLKGLKSHEGANFDVNELRVALDSRE